MKNVKFLLSAALVFLASAALAQDFSAPQYAKWGATPEEREQNILNSNFLKESCDNRDYDAAAHYLKGLIDKIPDAAESIYQRGAVVYKNKINRAKSVAEKNMFIDSLMLMYDMRAQYFGDNVKPGKTAFILDQKAVSYTHLAQPCSVQHHPAKEFPLQFRPRGTELLQFAEGGQCVQKHGL